MAIRIGSRPRTPTYANRNEMKRKTGRYLLERYRATGLSRREAADRAGISAGYLTGILAGRIVQPSPEILRAMAGGWHFSYLEFFIRAGLIEDRDVDDYVAKRKTLPDQRSPELEAVLSQLMALPPGRRKQVGQLLMRMVETVATASQVA